MEIGTINWKKSLRTVPMYRKGDIKRVNATKADVSTVASVSLCVKRRTCFEEVLRCASCTPCISRNALRTCHCVTDFLFSHRIYCNTVSQLMRLAWGIIKFS